MTRHFALALAALLGCASFNAVAQQSWPEALYNPQPQPDDLVLPMPCGGRMTFRPVEVSGDGVLDDLKIILGGRDPTRAHLEQAGPEHLSGSFRSGKSWRYYLGKYEVTNGQYAAIAETCADATSDTADFPKTRISFAEAALAAERYSAWLAANAQKALPKEDGVAGHVRLPTEAEWEYAARGGGAVSQSAFEQNLPPMDGAPEGYIAYCTQNCDSPEPIGAFNPNPLGLHDMLGNVAELTHGLFQMRHVGRPHGRAGGYVKRGGDYFHKLQELHSGLRNEFTPLSGQTLRREPTTGLRFAVSAPVLPTPDRIVAARAAWPKLAASRDVELGAEQADPREELRTLAAYVDKLAPAGREELVRRLQSLADIVDTTIATRNAQRDRALREMLRVAAVMALRLPEHASSVDRCEKLAAANPRYAAACVARKKDRATDEGYYLDHLAAIAKDYSVAQANRQADALETEFKARGQSKGLAALPQVVSDVRQAIVDGLGRKNDILRAWARFKPPE